MVDPLGCWREIRQRPPLKLKTSMAGPREVMRLEIQKRPPPTLRNDDGGPPGGASAGDLGAQRLQSQPLKQGGEWLQKCRDKYSKCNYNTFHPYSGWALLMTLFLGPRHAVCPS
jgi:hypothetical protein